MLYPEVSASALKIYHYIENGEVENEADFMYEQGSAVCLDLFAYTKHRKDMQETMETGMRAEGGWEHRWE